MTDRAGDDPGRAPPAVPAVEPAPGAGAAAATTGTSVLSGAAWSTAARTLPQLFAFAQSVVVGRYLGPDGLGRQSFIAFVELSLALLLSGGIGTALMRYVGDSLGRGRPGAAAGLVAWAWRIEAVAAALGAGVLVAAGLLGAEPEAAWLLAAVVCFMGVLHSVPAALLYTLQRWRAALIAGLVSGAAATVLFVPVLEAGWGITGLFVVEAAMSTATLVWTTALARRAQQETIHEFDAARDLRGPALRYAALTTYGVLLVLVVWRRSEFFVLDLYSTDTQIALYSVAFALVAALVQLPEALGSVVVPAVSTLAGAGQTERIRAGFGRGLRLLALVSLPLTAGGLALGPAFLALVYGEEFRGTGPVLLVLLAPFPLVPLLHLSRSLLAGLGRLRVPLGIETATACLNVGLAFVLIPGRGALGAAVANVVAQLATTVLVLLYALRSVGGVAWRPSALARMAFASLATGLSAWGAVRLLGGVEGLLAGLAAGAIVFALLGKGLRVLPAEDARWLDDVAGRRLGGAVGWVCRHAS